MSVPQAEVLSKIGLPVEKIDSRHGPGSDGSKNQTDRK